jgi:hypothetical protein
MPAELHIDLNRLKQLSAEAIIADDGEVRHLRDCEECQEVLRSLVKERQARLDSTSPESTRRSA